MLEPAIPENEAVRVGTLRQLNVLDTPPEERFDRLTRLAKRLFGVPIALVSLVDTNRQWFKSCIGLPVSETSRDISFCGHAILSDEIFVIPNALADERFFDNPLVTGDPNIRFYAGCPLAVPNGSKIGTLCLIDIVPREINSDDMTVLRDLASMAEQEIAAVQMATMDELTHLSNRRGFETLGAQALTVCKRVGKPASLLFFDLNDFKKINDSFGHAEGDLALVGFADVLKAAFRDSDVIARLGGDEFVVLLTNSNYAATSEVIKRLGHMLDLRNQEKQRGYDIRFSVGQVEYHAQRHSSIADMLSEADSAMYSNKQAKKSSQS